MKKLLYIVFSSFFILGVPINSVNAESNDTSAVEEIDKSEARGPVCEYSKTYTESVGSLWQDEQFRHIAEENSVVSDVSYSVQLTSSLAIKSGVEGDLNFLLANSSISFELGYTGSRTKTVTLTWKDIPAYETHVLIAGKKMRTVNGTITTRNTDCSIVKDYITVDGSIETYHTSYKQ